MECMGDIVYKGMKPMEKISLIVERLKVLDTIKTLPILQPRAIVSSQESIEFRETVAKFINILGMELVKICETSDTNTQEGKSSYGMALQLIQHSLFPPFITLLEDEYDDTSSALFNFCSAYLNLLKRIRVNQRLPTDDGGYAVQNFMALSRVVVVKMKYPIDGYTAVYADGDELSDDEALFQELRKVYLNS